MKPEIKEAIRQVIRFLTEVWNKITGSGVSAWKIALIAAAVFVGMFALGFALLGGVGSAFLGAVNEFADNGMTHWVIWKFALALMLTLLFIFTVGIPLMIDEARNWFTKVAACGVIVGTAVRMLSVFGPIVAGHPRASAILTVTVLILCVGAIAHMLGHGESVKGLSWFGKILAVVFVFWLILHGSCSSATRQEPAVAPKPTACTYCFGAGCEVSMPAEVMGPGHIRVRHPKYGTTADYYWVLNGTGSWKSQFPDAGGKAGGLRWTSQNYNTGEFKGEEWDESTSGKTPVFILCQGRVPHPDS